MSRILSDANKWLSYENVLDFSERRKKKKQKERREKKEHTKLITFD